MDRIDFSNLGGMPNSQNRLSFLQQSYTNALAAIATLCGNKSILYGVVNTGGTVSSGWISYNGELIPFIGGSYAAQVVITEIGLPFTFADNNIHNVEFTKTATCGAVGTFPFSDLVPLLSLQNMWRTGDIKERYCSAAYIAANFDGAGLGVNAEVGWQILSKQIPATAGKVMVNLDPTDVTFDTVGKAGGSKTHNLTQGELPAVHIDVPIPAADTSQGPTGYGRLTTGSDAVEPGAGPTLQTDLLGSGNAINIMNPYFVILKLIKL